jgi:hypothetical protein
VEVFTRPTTTLAASQPSGRTLSDRCSYLTWRLSLCNPSVQDSSFSVLPQLNRLPGLLIAAIVTAVMSVNLFYRRPAYVAARPPTPSMMSGTSSEPAGSLRSSKPPPPPNGVPEMLSFDRVVSDGTCPVSSLGNPVEIWNLSLTSCPDSLAPYAISWTTCYMWNAQPSTFSFSFGLEVIFKDSMF